MLIDPLGFLLKCPDTNAFPIDAHTVHYLVLREYIELPTITRDEIWDKSKADLFAKAATVIQSTWLIIGSIGRAASNLPLSPMETFTLAFIVSTVMSYFFWWRKPQNVETPTVIVCRHTIEKIRTDAGLGELEWERSPTEFVDIENKKWKRRTIFDTPNSPSQKHLANLKENAGCLSTLSVAVPSTRVDTASTTLSTNMSWKGVPSRVESNSTLLTTAPERPLPPRIYDDSILPGGLSPLILLSVALPSMVHSAIHLLGWNFDYPTYAEKQLWRSAAVVLNVMAAVSVGGTRALTLLGYRGRFNLIYIWVNNVPKMPQGNLPQNTSTAKTPKTRFWKDLSFWDAVLTFSTCCLLLARFAIITEVIISFRSLPKKVFITVNWTDFIPHI